MAQESNNVNFKVNRIVINANDLLLDIIMNERDFVLAIDKYSFDSWYTKGSNEVEYCVGGFNTSEQAYQDDVRKMPLSDWWDDMSVNNKDHNEAVTKFIEQDGYLKGALMAQYIHDTILYDTHSATELNELLIKYQGLIRDMFATNMLNRMEAHIQPYIYTKEIKIC